MISGLSKTMEIEQSKPIEKTCCSHSCSLPQIVGENNDSLTKNIDVEYEKLIELGKNKLENLKPIKIIGFNDLVKHEMIKLADDESFHQQVSDFIKSKKTKNLEEFFKNRENQDELIKIIDKYTKENGYTKCTKLLKANVLGYEYVKHAARSFMSDYPKSIEPEKE